MGRMLHAVVDVFLARRGLGASLAGLALATFLALLQPGEIRELGASWADMLNQAWPRDRLSEPVVIVAIDEASIEAVGAWPWPRIETARLFRRIAAAGPAAVGVDMLFAEPEGASPHALADRPGAPPETREWLLSQPTGDDVLAAAIASGPFVLAVGDRGRREAKAPEDLQRIQVADGARLAQPPQIAPLRSLEGLRDAASGEGAIALPAGFDGVARKAGQVFDVGGGALAPGLAVEMLRVASGANRIALDRGDGGRHRLTLLQGDAALFEIEIEPDGAARPWFGPRDTTRETPAIALLTDDDELSRLEGKLVLVGYTAAGGLDERVTPLEALAPGVEVHRQALESIFDGRLLVRPDKAPLFEILAALGLAAVVAFTLPRLQPAPAAGVWATAILMPLVVSAALYVGLRIVADGALPALAVVVAGLPAMWASLVASDRARRRIEAAQARTDGEMAAARRMQAGMLPKAADMFPGETRYSIAAVNEPARTVGGDLYDFFMLDERRLFFMVGDVAGKGPEASLFMAITKTLSKSAALRGARSVGEILTHANAEIARDNPEQTFVTVFACILDVSDGRLEFCPAGHDPGWRLGRDGAFSRLDGAGGPALCFFDDFDYPTEVVQLRPGDAVAMMTDGIPEAINTAGEMFGPERVDAAVRSARGAKDAGEMLERVLAPVRSFAEGAEQADDITALAVVWPGARDDA